MQPQPDAAPQDVHAGDRLNYRAVDSFVMSIMAFLLFPIAPLYALRALFAGFRARDEIDESGGAQRGMAFAVAGIVLGALCFGLWIVLAPMLAQILLGALARS